MPSQSSDVVERQADEGMNNQDGDPGDLSDPDVKVLYMRNLCLFYMRLQAKYLIPSSTVQVIAEEINSLSVAC